MIAKKLGVATGQSIGDIRLVGGVTDWEGRVEVLYDIRSVSGVRTFSWGTVCGGYSYYHLRLLMSQVVCRQLGYTNGRPDTQLDSCGVVADQRVCVFESRWDFTFLSTLGIFWSRFWHNIHEGCYLHRI